MNNKYKIDKTKVSRDGLILCWFCIVSCWVLKLLGVNDFNIPQSIISLDNMYIAKNIIYLALYVVNGLLFFLILLKRKLKPKEIILILTSNFIMYFVTWVMQAYNLGFLSMVFELLVYLGISLALTKNYKCIFESLFIYLLFTFYQVVSMITKNIDIQIANQNFIVSIIFQVDYYMLMLITVIFSFKKGGCWLYELLGKFIWNRWKAILDFFTKRGRKNERLQQNQENIQQEELGYKVFLVLLGFTQIFLVSVACYFVYNTIWNLIFIFVSFVIFRARFGKSYHANTIIKCTTISILTFYLATRMSLPLEISLLSTIFVGMIVAFFMHILNYFLENNNKCKRNTKREILLEILENNINEEYIEEYCTKIGCPNLSETIYLFLNNTTEEVADILDVATRTVQRRIESFIKKSTKEI